MLGKQILHRPRNYTLAWGLIGRHASSGDAITSIWLRYIRVRRSLVTVTRSVTPRKRFRLRLPHRVRLSRGCVTWAWRTANSTAINHAALNRLIDVNIENTESFNIQRCTAIIGFESARVKVLWIVSDSADLRTVFAEHLRIAHLLFSDRVVSQILYETIIDLRARYTVHKLNWNKAVVHQGSLALRYGKVCVKSVYDARYARKRKS